MLGQTQNTMDPDESKLKIALRDATVVFMFTLTSNLLAFGYPPSPAAVYSSLLSGLLTGIVSFMHAMGIKKPET